VGAEPVNDADLEGTEPAAAEPGDPGDGASGDRGDKTRRFGPPRAEFWRFVEIFAVLGLLLVQPLLDFLGKNQRALSVLRLSLSDVVIFTLLVLLVPPLVLWLLEVLTGLALPASRKLVHIGLVGVLIGLAAAAILKVSTHLGSAVWIITFVVVASAAVWALARWSAVWQWLHLLAIAPLLYALLFVAESPTSLLYLQHPKVADITIEHPARVVMIVFDEFPERSLIAPDGHLDRELFPNLASLADDGTWYRNESTVALHTGRAVPAILTGRIPPTKPTTAMAHSYPQSLFTLLGGTYEMHAREKYEQLCPTSLCTEPTHGNPVDELVRASKKVMQNLMDVDRTSWDHNRGFRWGADIDGLLGEPGTAQIAHEYIDSIQPSHGPRLDYLHILLPHAPWRFFDDFRTRGRDGDLVHTVQNSGDRNHYSLGRQLHLLQVQTSDWLLGQVMRRLKAMNEYDDSLIVVTADHGVAFPYWRAATEKNYPDLLWTPLFVKAPGQTAGRIDDRPMLSVDVLPTIADILGAEIPWKIDGISALGSPRPEGPRIVVTRSNDDPGEVRHYDGASGFQRVIHSMAAPPGGDPALRLYRIGPFGRLTGLETDGLVQPTPKWLRGTLTTPARWEHVEPDARSVPWAYAHGKAPRVAPGDSIAIAVNGRVAGLARVDQKHEYNALLAPTLFLAGTDTVTPYLVRGTPKAPKLLPIGDAPAEPSRSN
jgi:hypothetical protein